MGCRVWGGGGKQRVYACTGYNQVRAMKTLDHGSLAIPDTGGDDDDRVGQVQLRSSRLWGPLIAAEIQVSLHFVLGPQAPFPSNAHPRPSHNGNENCQSPTLQLLLCLSALLPCG